MSQAEQKQFIPTAQVENALPSEELKTQLRLIVRGYSQTMKQRVMASNRLVDYVKRKLGQAPGQSEETLPEDAKRLLELLRADGKPISETLTDAVETAAKRSKKGPKEISAGVILDQLEQDYNSVMYKDGVKVARFPTEKSFQETGLIQSITELSLYRTYFSLLETEKAHADEIKRVLNKFPIWAEFLEGVKGVGPSIAGVLVSEVDITKAEYPSSLWKLAGLDVAWDGKGRSKRREHMEEVEYRAADGSIKKKWSITFKPRLKATMAKHFVDCILRYGLKSPYAASYYNYKGRLEQNPKHQENYIALDYDKCMEIYDAVPKNIYSRSYVREMYPRAEIRALQLSPGLYGAALRDRTMALVKESLGKYEVLEEMQINGCVLGPLRDKDALNELVKSRNGVLRSPTEKEIFVEPESELPEDDTDFGMQTIEEFDATPDGKGRKLFRLKNIGKNGLHRHAMAGRYAAKRLLVDYYKAYRILTGLPVAEEWSVAKLGGEHGKVKQPSFELDMVSVIRDTAFSMDGPFTAEQLFDCARMANTSVNTEAVREYLKNGVNMGLFSYDGMGDYEVTIPR